METGDPGLQGARIKADNADDKARKMAEAVKGLRALRQKGNTESTDSNVSKKLGHWSPNTLESDAGAGAVVGVGAEKGAKNEHAHHIFMFSLSEPKSAFPKKAKLFA